MPGSRAARVISVLALLATLLVLPTGSSAADMAYSITISPDGAHAVPGSTPTWTVTVLDQYGSPVPNQQDIAWYVVGINKQGTRELNDDNIVTNDNGQVAIRYKGSSSTGVDQVTVFLDRNHDGTDQGEPSATTTVRWYFPDVVELNPTSVTRTIQLSDVAGYGLTSAHVTDQTGTGLFAAPVDVTISGPNPLRVGGTIVSRGTVYTDSTGTAYFYDVGHIAGIDTITANAGAPKAATATAQWIHGPGVLLASASSGNPVATNTALTINISLNDTTSPVPGVPIGIEITGKNTLQATVTTDADGNASYEYTSTVEGQDTLLIYADFDRSGTFSTGEPSNTVIVQWSGTGSGPGTGDETSSLTLSGPMPALTVGAEAVISAKLARDSGTITGVNVVYSISGANSGSKAATTNESGDAAISYTGVNPGTDTVTAYADLNGNGTQDSGEPSATVSVIWSAAPPVNSAAIDAEKPAQPQAGCTYFAETQHNMCGDFAKYWNAFGGLAIYGFPITEPFQENDLTVQYFERARFEAHPGTDDAKFNVLLGLVGDDVTAGRSWQDAFQPSTAKSGDCTFYAETGHNLCAGFQAYWEKYGGLAVYGYPISEEFQEVNPDTGQLYTVQYFERGRYEWHPGEWPERFDVELGRLGAQVFSMTYGTQYH
jgi:hypothetical protein